MSDLYSTTRPSRWMVSGPALIVATAIMAWTGGARPAVAEQIASRAPLAEHPIPAGPQRPVNCARNYHRRLTTDVAALTGEIWPTALRLRAADESLPGHWLFWDGSGILARTARQRRLLANPQFLARENRICVRSILARGGRISCLKWREVPEDYQPPPPKTPPVEPGRVEITDGERMIAAGVTRRVSWRGGLGELAFDTAFYHLVKRAADELDAYARQDFRQRICSGVPEMTAFYRARLAQLAAKETAAQALAQKAVAGANETLKIAAAAFDVTATADGAGEAEPLDISDLLAKVLSAEEFAAIEGMEPDLALLAKARDVLSDERFGRIEAARRGQLRKALRTAELAIYAEINADRLGQLHAVFDASFAAILEAHRLSCTCGE